MLIFSLASAVVELLAILHFLCHESCTTYLWDPCCHLVTETGSWFILIRLVVIRSLWLFLSCKIPLFFDLAKFTVQKFSGFLLSINFWRLSYNQFCKFSLHKNCITFLEPMLPSEAIFLVECDPSVNVLWAT